MKFERKKTAKSKRILMVLFYFSFVVLFLAAILRVSQDCKDLDSGAKYCEISGFQTTMLASSLNTLTVLSFLILLLVYIVHIFIEGLEKPKFVPTNSTNKEQGQNENT